MTHSPTVPSTISVSQLPGNGNEISHPPETKDANSSITPRSTRLVSNEHRGPAKPVHWACWSGGEKKDARKRPGTHRDALAYALERARVCAYEIICCFLFQSAAAVSYGTCSWTATVPSARSWSTQPSPISSECIHTRAAAGVFAYRPLPRRPDSR